jgi:hypothetical protein
MPVNTQHADYKAFLPKWERCRDTCAGQDAVHAGADKYLPRLQDQKTTDYEKYVMRAPFFNATWRTVSGLVGMLFRKEMKVEAPEALKKDGGLLTDVDGGGQPFQLFTQSVAEEALKYLRVGVLVDYPQTPENYTQADAIANNLRPTMQLYNTFSIINWKKGRVNNKTVLTQVVLHETKWIAKDEFEGKEEDRWRVLDLSPEEEGEPTKYPVYRQRLFKLAAGTTGSGRRATPPQFVVEEEIFPKMNGMPLTYIPFRIIGVDDCSFEVDDPPLIDLVDMNLSHYRTSADLEHGCHFTALPTLVLTGWKKENPNDKIYLGSEAALVSSNENAKATFAEFTGAGLKALMENLMRKEAQMAIIGARMLEAQKKGVEKPESDAIRRKGEESLLASISVSISLGMTQVLRWFAEWARLEPNGVKVELNRNFFPATMSPQMLTALIGGWQQGAPGLSDQGLFDNLKAGEIVAEDVTLEEEQARIADRQAEQAAQNAALNESMGLNPDGSPIEQPAPPPPKKKKSTAKV